MGGLGNMMFQVATAYSLSLDNDDECKFSLIDGKFSRSVAKRFGEHTNATCYQDNIFSKIQLINKCPAATYRERDFRYSKIPYEKNLCLEGYFQSEKYFKHNRKKIIELFDYNIGDKYDYLFDRETVSIHVRRGDYLNFLNVHPVCNLEYYKHALERFEDTQYKILVFSDDILWCKNNFNNEFVFMEGTPDYVDLFLMSRCDHHIIANSSFSWWGAWLNQNENKKIIAPKNWFGTSNSHLNTNDLYCDRWDIL